MPSGDLTDDQWQELIERAPLRLPVEPKVTIREPSWPPDPRRTARAARKRLRELHDRQSNE